MKSREVLLMKIKEALENMDSMLVCIKAQNLDKANVNKHEISEERQEIDGKK